MRLVLALSSLDSLPTAGIPRLQVLLALLSLLLLLLLPPAGRLTLVTGLPAPLLPLLPLSGVLRLPPLRPSGRFLLCDRGQSLRRVFWSYF